MKSYSFISTILLITFFSLSSLSFSQESEKETRIVVTKNTTKTELEKMVNDLKEDGIDMVIKDVKYNNKDQVRAISGEINFNDGHTADFEALKLKKIVIVRDYRPDAKKAVYLLYNPKD